MLNDLSQQSLPPVATPVLSPFERLMRFQIARPWVVLGLITVVTLASLMLAMRLKLITGFDALLPESRPSVGELHRVAAHTSSLSTIFVVLEGQDPPELRKAADALVPALKALGPPWVGNVEVGVQDVLNFVKPRAGLYTDVDTLRQLRDDIEARYAYEVGQQTGLLTGLDDNPPPPINPDSVKKRLGVKIDDEQRFPDGYYQSKDGKTVVIAIRSGVISTDAARGQEALNRVKGVVDRVNPRAFDPAAHWGLSGDLAIGVAEYNLIQHDLTEIGIVGAVLILSVVFLYYLRLRTVLAMTLTIGIGLTWTFGVTQLLLGHLNLATGFLFTIVGGNGINFSILLMARYLEERRNGSSAAVSVIRAQRRTWRPTLTAAAAAAASYGALIVTEFKGFREFGVIGGLGMLICWLVTYLALPSILTVMERIVPLDSSPPRFLCRMVSATAEGVPFGRPFAAAVAKAPRLIIAVSMLLAIGGAIETVRYVRSDPMEYDTNRIQSDRRAVAEVHRLIGIAIHTTGYIGLDGMAIMTDRVDQVAPLKAALEERRDQAPADAKPFKDVHTLQDFVPADQETKIPILEQIKRRILKARARKIISDEDWAKIEPYLPPDDLKPFGIKDLPEALARPFTELDGTRGRIVYISPLDGDVTSDAHYLLRWADSFRRTVLPDGSVILGSGRAVIYADMWNAILSDVPKAVAVSFAGTLLVVAFAFRKRRPTFAVMMSLLVGVLWMVGSLSVLRVKLNFLNFIALPITFGIGVDYAVNIVQRDLDLHNPLEVLRRTGGAVILCSLTTLLGYLALVRSVNFGVRSLGIAAVMGEVSCLMAAVLMLPAVLVWWRGRKERMPTELEHFAGAPAVAASSVSVGRAR
jgi:predicted RND superfamily exporter protein